jgi:hypothetical protein
VPDPKRVGQIPYLDLRTKPLGLLARIAALRRNPIEIWTTAHYEVPVMVGNAASKPHDQEGED